MIKLLIVIAITLVILDVALPKLIRDSSYTQEMAATKAITTLHTAESQYYLQYGRYATSLSQLGPPASGAPTSNAADLIGRDLATGEKRGFKFGLWKTSAGYALSVTPAAFGTSGTHTYYSDQSMAIHVHSGKEPATANDPLRGESRQQQPQTPPATAPPATAPAP